MKKRVLSMLLALTLCFSTLPMTALAQEADVVTEQQETNPVAEQEEQQETNPVAEQEGQQSTAPVAQQKEAEAAKPGTAEAPTKSISDSDAGAQNNGKDDETDAAVKAVQALIDALPETVTEENAESVSAQLEAIAEAMETLTEEQIAALDLTRLNAISEAMSAAMTVQTDEHVHPICGKTCEHNGKHPDLTWTGISSLDQITKKGNYYLTKDVTLTTSWRPGCECVLDLDGHSVTMNASDYAIKLQSNFASTPFTLTDCMGEGDAYGKITHGNNASGCGIYLSNYGYNNFVMYGGAITGNNGVGVTLSANIEGHNNTFDMYGGEISNNTNPNESTTSGDQGGGVYVAPTSTFNMMGGSITRNKTANTGGGVYADCGYYQSKVSVSGDVQITGNRNTKGATDNVYLEKPLYIRVKGALSETANIGVSVKAVDNNSYRVIAQGSDYTLTEDDLEHFSSDVQNYTTKLAENSIAIANGNPHEHPICGQTCTHNTNHSNALWTPLTYNATTQQLMYGSQIVSSTVTKIDATGEYYTTYNLPAGNYYLEDNIEMNGGTVTYNGNSVISKGGVITIETDVNLCLNGKKLSTSAPYKGVVVIDKKGTLTLSDCQTNGQISSSCTAYAGVQMAGGNTYWYSTFTMYGGKITGTDTGVLMSDESIFNMHGGTISGNKTGVSVVSTSKLTVGGSAQITDNANKSVFLYDKAMITIDSSLTNVAKIGVVTEKAPTDQKKIQVATGATDDKLDYSKIFTSDAKNQNYVVTRGEDGNLYLGIHQHKWTYTQDGDATIKVTCSADGCNLGNDFAATYTVTAPADLTYSASNNKKATVEVSANVTGEGFPAVPAITYQKQSGDGFENMAGVPEDAGTYQATITMDNQTAGVIYTINSKPVTNPTIEVKTPITYDGTAKKPAVVVKDGSNVIPDSEYSVSYENNINAGTATVTITDVAGGNYDVSGSTTFTIGKAAYSGTVAKTVNLIKGRSTEQRGTLTAAHFFPEGGAPEGAVISACNTSDSMTMLDGGLKFDRTTHELTYTSGSYIIDTGDQKCQVTISSTNYQDITATLIFHPTDKETVTITGLTYTDKTYDGREIQPTGTLTVSGDKVPVADLEVSYAGTGSTSYNAGKAPTDAGTYKVTYKVPDSNEDYTGEVVYTFTISPKTVTTDMIGTIDAQPFTGSDIKPEPVVKDGESVLNSGQDFIFAYSNNMNAGVDTATLTITGQGNYTGTASKTFTITPKNIRNASITLQAYSFVYTGLKQTVQIASVMLEGVALTEADYGIVKQSNEYISANNAITLTIEGKGNYTGTASTTWQITKADPTLGDFDVSPDLLTSLTYDGTPKTVTVQPKNGVIGMGAVKVYYEGSNGTTYTKSETAPVNAGSYQVTLVVSEGINYNAAQLAVGTMTIDKATLTPQPEDITEFFEYTRKGRQTINLAELVPGATDYVPGALTGDTGVLSEPVVIDAKGLMEFSLSELDINNVDNKVTVPVTIRSDNYEDVTVNVIIYISPEYWIIDGAGSSWTQNTTGTVVIRGNGEFTRFRSVKVDGKVIDPSNYTAVEGSTIITLKADYLRTLSAGSHTFAIVWDNGTAGTNFTVAANTSGNNSGNSGSNNGGNNSNNNDGNHGSDNSGNNDSGNTAGTTANTTGSQSAQELDKVPATGDASGIWLALFAVSLFGLAGMLVLRRKSGQKADPK